MSFSHSLFSNELKDISWIYAHGVTVWWISASVLKIKKTNIKLLLRHKFSPFVKPSENNCVSPDRWSYEWALFFFSLPALITVSNLLELCDSFQARLWMFKHRVFHLQGWRSFVCRNGWYGDCEGITQLCFSVGMWDVCVFCQLSCSCPVGRIGGAKCLKKNQKIKMCWAFSILYSAVCQRTKWKSNCDVARLHLCYYKYQCYGCLSKHYSHICSQHRNSEIRHADITSVRGKTQSIRLYNVRKSRLFLWATK